MYRYKVYTTIVIKGQIYQHMVIYKSLKEIDKDMIRYDTINRYYEELVKCDAYHIHIVESYHK